MSEIENLLSIIGIIMVVFSIIGGGLKASKTTTSAAGSLVRVVAFVIGFLFLLLALLLDIGFFKHL